MDSDDEKITLDGLKSALEVINNLRQDGADLFLDLEGADLSTLDLSGLDLSIVILRGANLSHASLRGTNLSGVDLQQAILTEVSMHGADLTGANLYRANLFGANLYQATLRKCKLSFAQITGGNLSRTDMSDADLRGTQITVTGMTNAILHRVNLLFAVLNGVEIDGSNFEGATMSFTVLAGLDLSTVRGLDKVTHENPSYLDAETLRLSKNKIPHSFLAGCGFQRWEILQTELHSPNLPPSRIKQICAELLDERLKGQGMRRAFISYSHADEKFVRKLYNRLQREGVIVWLDKHELDAGSLQKQIRHALSEQDAVIVVLSQNSVKSDWVENELELARQKEMLEKRDVLCPIAIDESWIVIRNDRDHPNRVLWRKLNEKYVLDFSKWNTKAFDTSFAKLVRGLKINYDGGENKS